MRNFVAIIIQILFKASNSNSVCKYVKILNYFDNIHVLNYPLILYILYSYIVYN